ncbi:hypothetical protein VUR80DRAFT_2035 [Thermomyces stellatus]
MASTNRPCGPGPPTDITYETFEAADTAIRDFAFANGYALVIHHRYPSSESCIRATYRCAKGRVAESRPKGDTHTSKRRKRSSQKVNCPYRVNLRLRDSGWRCEAITSSSTHNHGFIEPAAFASWRSQQLRPFHDKAIAMWNSGSRPQQIAAALRATGPDAARDVTPKDLSNLFASHRRAELKGLKPIQWLFEKLEGSGESFFFREKRSESGHIERLFIAPKQHIEFHRQAPDILLLDTTYKTNRFKMPLLSVCGITQEQQPFQIAAIFLDSEKEEQFGWALRSLSDYLSQQQLREPRVIVTNREQALINALEAHTTLRSVPRLLCRWHIDMDVLAKTKAFFPTPTRLADGTIERHPLFAAFLQD